MAVTKIFFVYSVAMGLFHEWVGCSQHPQHRP